MYCDKKHFIEAYGEEALRELIVNDIIVGTGFGTTDTYAKWCWKYGIAKRSTKNFWTNFFDNAVRQEVQVINGTRRLTTIDPPRKYRTYRIRNGNNQTLLELTLTEEEYKEYAGE